MQALALQGQLPLLEDEELRFGSEAVYCLPESQAEIHKSFMQARRLLSMVLELWQFSSLTLYLSATLILPR